jgi:hypothetical protein
MWRLSGLEKSLWGSQRSDNKIGNTFDSELGFVDLVDDRLQVGLRLDLVLNLLTLADLLRTRAARSHVLGAGVPLEGVLGREVAVRDHGATDLALVALVVVGLVDHDSLDVLEDFRAAFDATAQLGFDDCFSRCRIGDRGRSGFLIDPQASANAPCSIGCASSR